MSKISLREFDTEIDQSELKTNVSFNVSQDLKAHDFSVDHMIFDGRDAKYHFIRITKSDYQGVFQLEIDDEFQGEIVIDGMGSKPVMIFDEGGEDNHCAVVGLNLTKSDSSAPDPSNPVRTTWYEQETDLDETIVIVESKAPQYCLWPCFWGGYIIDDVIYDFNLEENPVDYEEFFSNHLKKDRLKSTVLCAQAKHYHKLLKRMDLWGLDKIATTYTFYDHVANHPSKGQNLEPVWVPSKDGIEQEFNDHQPNTPYGFYGTYFTSEDPANADKLARDFNGKVRMSPSNYPLITEEFAGERAVEDDIVMQGGKGTSIRFIDVIGFAAPGQAAGLNTGRDNSTVQHLLGARNEWFTTLADRGNMVYTEGSFVIPQTQHEELYKTHSVQGSINIGDDPQEHYVLPHYAQRVRRRIRFDHGLGLLDRFFTEKPKGQFPLTDREMDMHRAMCVAYGRRGFVTTNGLPGTNGNHVTERHLVKETILMAIIHAYTSYPYTCENIEYYNDATEEWISNIEDHMDLAFNPILRMTFRNESSSNEETTIYINLTGSEFDDVHLNGVKFDLGPYGILMSIDDTLQFVGCNVSVNDLPYMDFSLIEGYHGLLDGRDEVQSFGFAQIPYGKLAVTLVGGRKLTCTPDNRVVVQLD